MVDEQLFAFYKKWGLITTSMLFQVDEGIWCETLLDNKDLSLKGVSA